MSVIDVLSVDQCERLLRRGTFGRVGLALPRGPEILPVNYAVRDDAIVVRTSSTGTLATHGDGANLVFEVDLVEEDRWHGWSVVARGRGAVAPAREPARRGDPRPWVDGPAELELRLAWTELTGRQVGRGWDPEQAMYSRAEL